jgi:hypothetical protein
MKNRIVGLFILLFLGNSSCSNSNGLCDCIDKGAELNEFSKELLNSTTVTEEQEAKLNTLRLSVDEICAPYKEMGPEELYTLREACSDDLEDLEK